MAGSAVAGKSDKKAPNLWKEAHDALRDDEKGKERLDKLSGILREQLGKPRLKLRSEDGYKQLQVLIKQKSHNLSAKKSSEKIGKIADNMLAIKDIVAAGAGMGGPYVAIPAAALFLAFSMQQIYQSEKDAMFELARKVANYTVIHATAHTHIKISSSDNARMQELKKNLHVQYVALYKSFLLASAQLTCSLYGDWQFIKNLMKHYDWEGQMKEIEILHTLCKDYHLAQNHPSAIQPNHKTFMGPGPRNQLHWAVALSVPEQVIYLVQKEEYPINALTPKRWTAAHLAARHGNMKIVKTILTARGIDLRIKNDEGQTPLHIAARHNRVGAVKSLLHRDSRLMGLRDTEGRTAFLLAAHMGHVKVLEVLKSNGQDFTQTNSIEGYSAVHLAADNGKLEAVKFLLANGANKKAKIKAGKQKGMTAKQIAEFKKRLDIVAIL